ncbi:MAG: hypothetical protein U0575_11970 [Phycisphaerales bacterium]|jgi:hypothetical protein
MLRNILGAVAGYAATFVVIMITMTLLFVVLGKERAFAAATFDVSALFVACAIALSLVAAIVGGWVAALIGRPSSRAVMILVGIVLVLGIVSAAMEIGMQRSGPSERDETISVFEAAQHARQPLWYSLLLPVIGVAGVLLGGRLGGGARDGTGRSAARG